MNEIMQNLLVFAVFLIIAGIIFLLVRRRQVMENEKLEQFVRQHGWKIEHIREPLAKGFQITAPYWTLSAESRSSGREVGPGSTDMEQKTTWRANQPGSTMLVGPKTSQINLGASFEMLMKQIIFTALGENAREVNEVRIGSPEFQKHFMVWAQDAAEADRLISPMVQSALLALKGTPPLITRTSEGLSIELKNVHLRNPEDLLSLVHLGEMLS